MAIAQSVQQFMYRRDVTYDVATHDKTGCSPATAREGAVPMVNLAKGVLVKRREGYLLAIVPATCQVQLSAVGSWVGQPVGLATEAEVSAIFDDCDPGSVPPVAGAYGLLAVMDDRLEGLQDVYFEGGDHCTLVHVNSREFHRMMLGVPHARIGVEIN